MKPEPLNVILSWLQLQCQVLDGSIRAVVLLGDSASGSYRAVAQWPDADAGTPALTSAATQAIRRKQTVLMPQPVTKEAAQQTGDIIACPMISEDRVLGVVAVELGCRAEAQKHAAIKALEQNTAALEMLVSAPGDSGDIPARAVVELVAAAIEYERFDAAARNVTSRFAELGRLTQVSLGIRHGDRTEVHAASGRANVEARMQAGRSMSRAMDEAIELDTTLVYRDASDDRDPSLAAHAQLAALHGGNAMCSIPFTHDGSFLGAFTFEHPDGEYFDADTIAFCEAAVALAGPILYDKYLRDRHPLRKLTDATKHGLARSIDADSRQRGLLMIAAVGLLALPFFVDGHYRVTADAALEGAVQRTVAAPVDGFVAEAPARPGDLVDEGMLLARLDDRDLTLEQRRVNGEQSQLQREYRQAIAEHDNTRVAILRAQLDRAEAQLELIEEQLARTRIKAPMGGVIVAGDLSQSLGGPVEKGQSLFEIAPLDGYRVMLKVDERDIGELRVGLTGHLALVGLPNETLPFRVERITPVSTQAEGRNRFAVEATLDDPPALLRPGMEGIGKVDIGDRALAWIWTHRLTEWLRLWVWSWSG